MWAPIGSHARRRDFSICGKWYEVRLTSSYPMFHLLDRYSVLPALSLDGIIAVEVLDRPFTAATFSKFIEGLLDEMNPWLQ